MSTTNKEVKRQFTDADFDLLRGIMDSLQRHGSFTNDFASIASGAKGTAAIDVSAEHNGPALEAGDEVLVTIEDDLDDGIVLASAEVTDADEITVRILNTTGGAVDGAEMTFYFWAPLTFEIL